MRNLIQPQKGPQDQFSNMWDEIPLVFYGGEICASLLGNK